MNLIQNSLGSDMLLYMNETVYELGSRSFQAGVFILQCICINCIHIAVYLKAIQISLLVFVIPLN